VYAELDGTNQLIARYLHGDEFDQTFARVDLRAANASERVQWYLTDHLNSVRLVLDETGAVLDQIAYDAFGNIVAQLNPLFDNPILFASRDFDAETGLYYNRVRYLDPFTGRWTTQDPLGYAAGDANLYRYVGNMATMATDPSGNIFFVPFVVGALLVGGGSVGLHIAANRYDHATSILARPPSPANDAEFRRVYNQARWIHAGSNVAVVSGGTLMVSPGIGYGAGWLAGTGTVGTGVVTVAGAGGIAYVGWDGYTIFRDWNVMGDDAERFERIGTLVGPILAGGYPGYRGFRLGYASNSWTFGANHSAQQWANKLAQRGWTPQQISEAIAFGQRFTATNNINPANGATRYVHPITGRSVVVDNVTGEVIHVGGTGFVY
jgi:RHS repeat-associated protein